MWRQVNVNVFRMFPRRPTTTDTVESMMMRVMKPMKITTAISQRGNVNTHTQQERLFQLFSVTIHLLLQYRMFKVHCDQLGHHRCTLEQEIPKPTMT